jgi:hypothetical protein
MSLWIADSSILPPAWISSAGISKLLYDWQSVSQSVYLGIEYPCGACDQILFPVGMLLYEICGLVSIGRPLWREDGSVLCSRSPSWSYFATDSQSGSMSWYRVPLWDLRPDITSCRNVAVWTLRSCFYWVPSLTRGWVCNLQCNHSIVRVTQNLKPYFTVSSETPPGTGWPSYTPGHWVPFTSSLKTRRATVEVF